MITPLKPAARAVAVHWRQSMSVGLKMSSVSVPSPHSAPVKVLGPKWQNMFISICCQATCAGVGQAPKGAGGLGPQEKATSAAMEQARIREIGFFIKYGF